MCELMALSFARPLSASISIRAFSGRGAENADGWGLAWYPEGPAAALVKEPVEWGSSRLARFLEGYPPVRSSLYVAHVRHKTAGADRPTFADTHPFLRPRAGRDYVFAHNGTLDAALWELPTGPHVPLGETDSERAFCRLLHEMDGRGGHLDDPDSWRWLRDRLSALNALGKLNVLMTDGRRVFAYHDLGGWKGLAFGGLSGSGHLGDDEWAVELDAPGPVPGAVVATRPLDDGPWRRFQRGELIVFEAGSARFSSVSGHRSAEDAEGRR